MPDINLLPWREARRKKTNKTILLASIAFWTVCTVAGVYAVKLAGEDITKQQSRNRYLLNQNAALEREIGEIKVLQANKQNLIERMQMIENLQHSQMHTVHIFDDIVRKLPAGVTLDRMSKKKNDIFLEGRAETNSKISELMTNFNTSQWFGQTKLSTINTDDKSNSSLNAFELMVTQKLVVFDSETTTKGGR